MRRTTALLLVLVLAASYAAPVAQSSSTGKFNTTSGCSCHYGSGSTVSLTGTPTDYTPGQTYSLTISVSGPAGSKGGFSLNVSDGAFSNPGTSAKVNSQDTSQATHSNSNQRSWTLDWTAPTSGSGTASFTFAGNAVNGNGDPNGDAPSTGSKNVPEGSGTNNAPSVSNILLTPSPAYSTDLLQMSYSYFDSDGDSESGTEIRWYRDSSILTLRNDETTVPDSMTAKGQSWYVTVTPSDGADDGNPVSSSTVIIANSPPTVQSASISPSSPVQGEDLVLSANGDDDDDDVTSIDLVQWYVDGVIVNSLEDETTVPAIAARNGDVWHAKVKVSDNEDTSQWFTTQTVTIGGTNTAPTMTSVSLDDEPYYTVDDLTATWDSDDADGDSPSDYQIKWKLNSAEQAQDGTTISSADTIKGQTWQAGCRVSDGEEWSAWMWSSGVTIQNTAPQLNSLTLDQDLVLGLEEVTYSFDGFDADEDQLTVLSSWEPQFAGPPGTIHTLTIQLRDDDGALSSTLSDTVTIQNSQPTVNFSGETSQDSLSELAPSFSTDDVNSDQVSLSFSWLKNGFSTAFNSSSIPASNLGPGDIWTVMVTPNDGNNDGLTLSVSFTISNLAPSANIVVEDQAWIGVSTTLSAVESTDIDGVVVDAVWEIDSQLYSGIELSYVPISATTTVNLIVYDDSGAQSDSTSIQLSAITPPQASDLKSKTDGTKVTLTWDGQSSEWAIYRNGVHLGNTEDLIWKDQPPIEGIHTYSVYPVIEGITLSVSSQAPVEISAADIAQSPGPEYGFGMMFSILMIVVGIASVGLSFVPRRD
ncbi:MAG: choice-of-anchor V domain-containing protein [Candidatus Poseidoniales archaeon]